MTHRQQDDRKEPADAREAEAAPRDLAAALRDELTGQSDAPADRYFVAHLRAYLDRRC